MSVSASVKTAVAYRPHIDGLRGLSIIMMIFYHARFFGDTGGFVGVDIFFVISGFLITSIIVRDIKAGVFSLVGFWERRIRRIIPPLFIAMVFVIIGSYFLILYPADYHHVGNAVIAQSVFGSNMLFTVTDNYFDQNSRYSPLLHTWTLSLEEQFYLMFPFLILLCIYVWRKWFKGRALKLSWERIVLAAVAALGLLSFLTSIWFTNVAPSSGLNLPFVRPGVFWQTSLATAGFYLLPTRAWEIALGIVLALTAFKILSKALAETASLAGLGLIVAPVFLLNDGMPYPGLAALLPTLGTLMIIAANEEHRTIGGTLLSYRALVGVGLISYALYLWYWPLFVFTDLLTLFHTTPLDFVIAIGLAAALATLSYFFIETPIRKKRLFTTTRKAYVFGIGSMALLALSGVFIQQSAFAQTTRIPPAAQKILLAATAEDQRQGECFVSPQDTGPYSGLCRIGSRPSSGKADFVLWGDSHADALAPIFNVLGKQFGVQGAVFAGGACMPVEGVNQSPPANECEGIKERVLAYIKENDIKTVFLVARWSYYVMGGPDQRRVAFITDSNQITTSREQAQQVFERHLGPTVRALVSAGRHVIIVEQVPEQFHFDTREAFYAAVRGSVASEASNEQENVAYEARANSVIQGVSTIPGVSVIDPTPMFCPSGGLCDLQRGGAVLYRDENHLSVAGALALEPLFETTFKRMHLTR